MSLWLGFFHQGILNACLFEQNSSPPNDFTKKNKYPLQCSERKFSPSRYPNMCTEGHNTAIAHYAIA